MMSITFPILIKMAVFLFACWWCKEIIYRLPDDLAELKQPDTPRRIVIIGLWLVTAVIVFVTVWYLVPIVIDAWRTLHQA